MTMLLTGCSARGGCDCIPPWPLMPDEAKQEVRAVPEDERPALNRWLGKLALYREALEMCR